MSEYDFMLKRIRKLIIDVPDFPKPGITFKDITPLLQDQSELYSLMKTQARWIKNSGRDFDKIVAIESRGFIFGSLLAQITGLPLVLARKAGKLPRETVSAAYGLEYGSDKIEIHKEDIKRDEHILIVDDVLATGGTATAVANIVDELGGLVAGFWFLMQIKGLEGHDTLVNETGVDDSDIEVVLH
jgi:adenine phosphoribosyltransferase